MVDLRIVCYWRDLTGGEHSSVIMNRATDSIVRGVDYIHEMRDIARGKSTDKVTTTLERKYKGGWRVLNTYNNQEDI